MLLAFGLVLFAFLPAPVLRAQEVPKAAAHDLLQKDIGVWDATMKIWPMPAAEPIVGKGVEENELLGDGLWLVTKYKGGIAGMNFNGLATLGYDPTDKKYVGTWIDSMSPFLTTLKGDYDPQAKTLTMTAEGRSPQSGKIETSKHVVKYIDDNTRTFEIYMPGDDGKEWKMLEVEYKRRAE